MNLIVKYVVQTCDTYIESNSSSTFTPKKKSSSTMRVTTFIITKKNNGRLYFILKFLNFVNEVSLGVYMLIFLKIFIICRLAEGARVTNREYK